MVSSSGYMVQGFEGMGYLVSRVQGTWLLRYGVHSFSLSVGVSYHDGTHSMSHTHSPLNKSNQE